MPGCYLILSYSLPKPLSFEEFMSFPSLPFATNQVPIHMHQLSSTSRQINRMKFGLELCYGPSHQCCQSSLAQSTFSFCTLHSSSFPFWQLCWGQEESLNNSLRKNLSTCDPKKGITPFLGIHHHYAQSQHTLSVLLGTLT